MQHQSLPSDFSALLHNMKETVLLTEEPVSIFMTNAVGEHPIHVFAVQGDVDGVARCLELGADINVPGEHGFTALHEAATQGHVDVVKFLLERGANPKALSTWGQTAFEATSNLDDEALSEILKLLGAAQSSAAPQPDLKDKR